MDLNIEPKVIATILNAVCYRRDGGSLRDILDAFPTPQVPQQVQAWIKQLVAVGVLDPVRHGDTYRYLATDKAEPFMAPAGTRPAQHEASISPTSTTAAGPAGASVSPAATPPAESAAVGDPAGNGSANPAVTPTADNGGAGVVVATPAPTPFAALFEPALPQIVLSVMPRASAAGFLRLLALQHLPGSDLQPFLAYALDRLSHLTSGECARHGLEPQQYELWRRQYAGATASEPPAIAASTAAGSVHPAPSAAGAAASAPGATVSPPRAPAERRSAAPLSGPLPPPTLPPGVPSPSRSASAWSDVLTDGIGRLLPRDLDPKVRLAVVGTVAAAALYWLQSAARSPWVLSGLALAAVVGLLWFAPRRKDKSPMLADSGSEPPTDGAGATNVGVAPTAGAKTGAGTGAAAEAAAEPGATVRTATAGAPVPLRQRPRRRTTAAIAAVAAVALAGGVAVFLARRPGVAPRPSDADVRTFLAASAGALPVRLADLHVTVGNATDNNCRLTYEARFETTEPLFRRIDTTEYLRTHGAATAPISDLKFPISDVGPAPTPALESLVLVTTQTPPGASATATGTLVAWKHDATWIFTGDPVRLDRATLAGDPKPAGALAVDLPEDAARLQALIAGQVAYAAKIQAVAKAFAEQREREVQQRKAAFSDLLRVGALFTGVVDDPTKHQPQRFVLEITAATPPRVTAVLRNEGGWTDVRPFQGEWFVGADGEAATVTLRTTSNAAIDGAGPLLQDRMDWALAFSIHADGTGAAEIENRNSKIENGLNPQPAIPAVVQKVDASSVADLRTDWTRGVAAVLTATRAGAVYRGTALSKIYRTTETVWLRFGAPGTPGQSSTFNVQGSELPGQPIILDATVAPAAGGAGRAFRGTLIANTYRAGGSPVRLQSADADRVAGADGKSVLGITTGAGLALALRLEGDRLVGQDAWFTYEFAPDPATANAGPGTRDQGPGVQSNATGSWGGNLENGKSGNVGNEGGNAEGSASPQSEIRTPQSLPPFPAAGGAYGLVAGRWVALPHNGPAFTPKGKRLFDSFFSGLEEFERKLAGRPVQPSEQIYGALTFSGKESIPWLPADAVTVIYVGEMAPLDPKLLKKYPALELEPPMELGLLHTLDGGSRSILLTTIYPGAAGFGPRRIEATVERRAPRVMLLRATGPLEVGRYALTCSDQQYELGVVGVE